MGFVNYASKLCALSSIYWQFLIKKWGINLQHTPHMTVNPQWIWICLDAYAFTQSRKYCISSLISNVSKGLANECKSFVFILILRLLLWAKCCTVKYFNILTQEIWPIIGRSFKFNYPLSHYLWISIILVWVVQWWGL